MAFSWWATGTAIAIALVIFRFLIFIFVLLSSASSYSAGEGLQMLQAFFRSNQQFKVEFTQKVIGGQKQISHGILAVNRPNKFYWQINTPFAQQIIGDGVDLWIYDHELKQVTVKKQSTALGNTPLALLAGKSLNSVNYQWQNYAGEAKLMEHPQFNNQTQVYWLQGKAKKEEILTELRLAVADNKIIRMHLRDSFANETQIDFYNYNFHPNFTKQDFTFTPPVNADIIREQ